MRRLSAVIAGMMLAWMLPSAGHADVMPRPARLPAAAQPAGPGCHCLPVQRHVRHVRRHVRRYARFGPPAVVPLPPYNPLLPNPWNSDYDRAMTLHFRAAPVTGILLAEAGYAPLPPVAGVAPYVQPSAEAVYQYDGLIGQYVALAQADVRRMPPAPSAPH